MRFFVVAASCAVAVLGASPALSAVQEQGAQPKQARPRPTAATRAEQPASSGPVNQAERRRPPTAEAVEPRANDEQTATSEQRPGAVRRPPSESPSGGRSSGSSVSSADHVDYAVPRRNDPRPSGRGHYYPSHPYYNRYYGPYGYGYSLGYFYYSPWGFGPWYWPGWYGYGYGHGHYSSSGYDLGRVKLKVKPRDAEVLVDGYYAGTVDDFDGIFQALKLDTRGYKIEIRKPGFETLVFDVHVQPDRTITYRADMKAIP